MKIAANGRQTLTLPLVIFLDETSGNRTKKWNKLETYSFFLASLPREEVTKFSNINFVCVSNLLDSETLGKVIAEDLLGIHSTYGIEDIVLVYSIHRNVFTNLKYCDIQPS